MLNLNMKHAYCSYDPQGIIISLVFAAMRHNGFAKISCRKPPGDGSVSV